MTWNLFIDDERYPVDEPGMFWEIARNLDDVCYLIATKGFPQYISFDHDLGENEKTGYDIVKLLVEGLMDGQYEMPENFDYFVHSQNPVGKANIESYLNNYIKHVKGK